MATLILIVEDEATLREALAYNLAHEGYQVKKSGMALPAGSSSACASPVCDYTAMMMRSDWAG